MNSKDNDGIACACGALASVIVVIRAESLKVEGRIDVACEGCVGKVHTRGLSKLRSEEEGDHQ